MGKIWSAIPADLKPEWITILVDSREKEPFDMSPFHTEIAVMQTGDYSVKGLEHVVVIERKSLRDLIACIGVERYRFEREMQRMLAYPSRLLLIEASWYDIECGNWKSRVTPQSALGSLMGWMASGVPIMMCGDHAQGAIAAKRFLYIVARRRWREARGLLQHFQHICNAGGDKP